MAAICRQWFKMQLFCTKRAKLWLYSCITVYNRLQPKRRQVNIRSYDGPIQWRVRPRWADAILYAKSSTSPQHHNDVIMGAIASQITSPYLCLLSCLFRRRSKKTLKLCVTGLCVGNSPVTAVNSQHKWPVTRKIFPFDDVIMMIYNSDKCGILWNT